MIDVVCVAANLFAAGQETTVRLLSTAVMMIAEDPALQAKLRADRESDPRLHRGGAARRESDPRATSGCPKCPSPSAE